MWMRKNWNVFCSNLVISSVKWNTELLGQGQMKWIALLAVQVRMLNIQYLNGSLLVIVPQEPELHCIIILSIGHHMKNVLLPFLKYCAATSEIKIITAKIHEFNILAHRRKITYFTHVWFQLLASMSYAFCSCYLKLDLRFIPIWCMFNLSTWNFRPSFCFSWL